MMRTRAWLSVFFVLFLLLLGVKAEARPIALAWDANTESNIAGYVVVYGYASGAYTASVDVGNKTNVTLQNLPDNQTIYFAVKAYNTVRPGKQPFKRDFHTFGGCSSLHRQSRQQCAGQATIFGDGLGRRRVVFVGPGVDAVHIYAYPALDVGHARVPGACELWCRPRGCSVGPGRLTIHQHRLCAAGHELEGRHVCVRRVCPQQVTGTWAAATRTIRVAAGPLLTIESPTSGSLVGQPFYVTGWAMDTRAAKGTGVNAVQIFSQPVGGGTVSSR